jgi:drug/metabolite transporter (DMT)-like permease
LKNKIIPLLLLVLLALTWGSSFILMKKGLATYDSNQVAALRMLIAFIVLLPFGMVHLKRTYPGKWKYFLAVGLFGNFLPAFLFTLAETRISSSLAGLLNSLTPIFTLILGAFFYSMPVKRNHIFGIILGFIGAAMLIIGPGIGGFSTDAQFGLLIVLATLFYGISLNVIRKFLADIPSVTITFWAFMMVGPPAGLYLLTTDVVKRTTDTPGAWESLGFIAILGIIGTAGAVMVFNILIKKTSAIFASSVTYLIPIVALGWGILDNETMDWVQGMAILVILAGIFMINRPFRAENSANFGQEVKKV